MLAGLNFKKHPGAMAGMELMGYFLYLVFLPTSSVQEPSDRPYIFILQALLHNLCQFSHFQIFTFSH